MGARLAHSGPAFLARRDLRGRFDRCRLADEIQILACICLDGSRSGFGGYRRPPVPRRRRAGKFELSAIDVGQGDSLLAGFPTGPLMLIDAGGIPSFGRKKKPGLDIGEDVVSPYLWSRSIKRLDVVVMTHAHEDHMGGMSAVLRNFHPRELWTGATQDSVEWRTVRETAERLHITDSEPAPVRPIRLRRRHHRDTRACAGLHE